MSTLDVREAARDQPDRDAMVVDDRVLTWSDVAALVATRADELIAGGARPGGARPGPDIPVPIVATATLDAVVSVLALIDARVPAFLLHPALTDEERRALTRRIAPLPGTGDEQPLAVVFTSGSSGTPKGIVLSRRAFQASARANEHNLGWRDDDRWLLRIPVAHIGGLSTVTRCLIARRCIVLADDRVPLREQIVRDRVTIASLVPTQLRRLLDEEPGWRPPARLRAVLLGGGAASAQLLRDAADAGWPVLTTYGMTETCSQVVTQPYGSVNRGELGSGRALEGVELRIVDDVIRVRGPMLFSGYLGGGGGPDADGGGGPDADGWYVTGDRGRLDEHGFLHVLGRGSDLIISGGENVDPLEVEAVLRDVPGVRDACVFGVADREWGERVAAVVVPEGDIDIAALDRALRDRLAGYKRPRLYATASALPLTRAGKIDRRAAAARFSERAAPPAPPE